MSLDHDINMGGPIHLLAHTVTYIYYMYLDYKKKRTNHFTLEEKGRKPNQNYQMK